MCCERLHWGGTDSCEQSAGVGRHAQHLQEPYSCSKPGQTSAKRPEPSSPRQQGSRGRSSARPAPGSRRRLSAPHHQRRPLRLTLAAAAAAAAAWGCWRRLAGGGLENSTLCLPIRCCRRRRRALNMRRRRTARRRRRLRGRRRGREGVPEEHSAELQVTHP